MIIREDPTMDEITLADRFLFGKVTYPTRGPGSRQYIPANSQEDKKARHALAKILRSGKPPLYILDGLAELFDDATDRTPERKLQFAFRRAGRRTHPNRDLEISLYISELAQSGHSVEKAVDIAAGWACLSAEAVWKIWTKYKKDR